MDWPEPARFPDVVCPVCGHTIDAASEVDGRAVTPDDGDYSLCVSCCEPSIYTVNAFGIIGLRKATPEERGTIFKEHAYEIALMQEIKRGPASHEG